MVFPGGRDRRGGQAGRRFPARRGWRGLAVLGKLVGALFVIQLLFVAGTPAVWLL